MYDIYIKKITIEKVRHLRNVTIPLGKTEKKHLVLTGKNGSGKTSLIKAVSHYLDYLASSGDLDIIIDKINIYNKEVDRLKAGNASENSISQEEKLLRKEKRKLEEARGGVELEFSIPEDGIKTHFEKGEFVIALYEANRKFEAIIPNHVEKVKLKGNYRISESPRNEFIKYILDLKMTEALAKTSGKDERAKRIQAWFNNFEKLLKEIFEDDSIRLQFDEETFKFSLNQDGREPFNFQELSDGFAAVLDIVVDLMVRMEKHLDGGLSFDLPGIVLIDEIETHLHLELQKKVMDFLMNLFPNIQFIVSTHSPFILSSARNSVIFDLENKTLVDKGLTGLPYEGVVKGFFKVDSLSRELRTKYDRYKELTNKKVVDDNDIEEIAEIEMYLDEIPDYLALDISTEYRRIKTEFEAREDL